MCAVCVLSVYCVCAVWTLCVLYVYCVLCMYCVCTACAVHVLFVCAVCTLCALRGPHVWYVLLCCRVCPGSCGQGEGAEEGCVPCSLGPSPVLPLWPLAPISVLGPAQLCLPYPGLPHAVGSVGAFASVPGNEEPFLVGGLGPPRAAPEPRGPVPRGRPAHPRRRPFRTAALVLEPKSHARRPCSPRTRRTATTAASVWCACRTCATPSSCPAATSASATPAPTRCATRPAAAPSAACVSGARGAEGIRAPAAGPGYWERLPEGPWGFPLGRPVWPLGLTSGSRAGFGCQASGHMALAMARRGTEVGLQVPCGRHQGKRVVPPPQPGPEGPGCATGGPRVATGVHRPPQLLR